MTTGHGRQSRFAALRNWIAGRDNTMTTLFKLEYREGRADAMAEMIAAMRAMAPPAPGPYPQEFESMKDKVVREQIDKFVSLAVDIGGLGDVRPRTGAGRRP